MQRCVKPYCFGFFCDANRLEDIEYLQDGESYPKV